jgi:hypothetical protein
MVISVLAGLIIAYFMNHLTVTYNKNGNTGTTGSGTGTTGTGTSVNASTNANIASNVPMTHIQSTDSSTANLSNSNSFGFFQSGK